MSFYGLQASPYSEVAAILPQYKKNIVEDKTNRARVNLKGWVGTGNETTRKQIANFGPITVAIGVILCLAGIFLTLARHRVLPHGVNAISEMGIWGQVAGYGGLGVGFMITLVGGVQWYFSKRNSPAKSSAQNNEPDVSATHYNAEVAEMDSYFPNRVKADELFAVDNPARKEITIYYKEWDAEEQIHFPGYKVFNYKNSTPEAAFQNWFKNNQNLVQDKHFIDLSLMNSRTQEFETRRKQQTD